MLNRHSKLVTSLLKVHLSLIRAVTRCLGFDLVRWPPATWSPATESAPALASPAPHGPAEQLQVDPDGQLLRRVAKFTMTSVARQRALIDAVRYVASRELPGSIVECGVWRGGSSMLAALVLQQCRDLDRDLYLFDTFTGMTPPSEYDVAMDGISAQQHLINDRGKQLVWCIAELEDVRHNMYATGYPAERIHFIQGPVEQTVSESFPAGSIALLRLDTDWYESTRHELEHLFPRLVRGGVLIIDDYGHWQGARKAVDEYLLAHGHHFLMHRLDYTGRMLIKA